MELSIFNQTKLLSFSLIRSSYWKEFNSERIFANNSDMLSSVDAIKKISFS